MKATMRSAAKACLVTAASGLLCSQVAALLAQDGDGPKGKPPTSAKVVQAQGYATQTAAVQSSPDADSSVQKELEKLYKKNRREMPSMSLEDAPNTQGPMPPQQQNPAARPGPAPVASTAPSPAAQAAPKANWFERTFHVGRGRRKPAPAAEYAAPATPRTPAYRMTSPSQTSRPAQPAIRGPIAAAPGYQAPPSNMNPTFTPPPVTAGPAASAPPAQPQLREPSPLAPSPAARELTTRPSQPPTVRPARPRISSQPMLDESGTGDDESLDIDGESKPAAQAPQILSNRNEGKAASDSPYSGLKISPNEEEQRITSRPHAGPAPEATSEGSVEDLPDAAPQSAGKARTEEPFLTAEKPSTPAAKARTGIAPKDEDEDNDDDEEDDEDMLSLPSAKSGPKPRALSEPAVLKAAKVMEKIGAPVAAAPAAAPVAAPVVTPAPTAASPAAPAVETSPAAPLVAAPADPVVVPAVEPTPAPVSGLKGICPVALKDSRKLIDARPTIQSTYKGKIYTFSSVEAKQAFDENPHRYAPVSGGGDVVKHASGEKEIEGTLEHAAWYRGRLYLFSTAESRLEFVDTPAKFVIED